MRVSVSKQQTKDFVPDVGDNLEQGASEQWVIVLRAPSKFHLSSVGFTTQLHNGVASQSFDQRAYYEAFVVRHRNAPDIEIDGGKTRRLRTGDLFEFDTFIEVVNDLGVVCQDLVRPDEEDEVKNS